MRREEIEKYVREVIGDIVCVPANEIGNEIMFMSEYNLDSLRALEVLAAVENKYGILINPDLLSEMKTVRNIASIVEEVMGKDEGKR